MKTLLLTMLIWAQDLSLKPQYTVPVGQFLVITPDTKALDVKYVPLTEGLFFLDQNLLKDKKQLVLTSSKSGSYKLLAYTAIDNKLSDPVFTTIVVGDTPKPNNELEEILKSVYGADADPNKLQYKEKMLNGFKAVLKDIDSLNIVGDLNTSIKDKLTNKLAVGEGGALRSVLKDELSNQFGINPDVSLDKNNAKKVLTNIVDILGRL
jgi:hypothetical protein